MKLHSLKRSLIALGTVFVLAGLAAPFVPMDFLKPGLEGAMARSLGRPVEIGTVSLSLWTGPGFAIDGVTIHEDPRAGIEPFAYAGSVTARVDLLGLLQGRRGFSSLRFNDASLNLVKTDAGPWNFQLLLESSLRGSGSGGGATTRKPAEIPSIEMRAGRINLKFGNTKSIVYFGDADVTVSPHEGSVDLRFSGVPSRTDRSAQNFGHFFVNGTYTLSSPQKPQSNVNLTAELEPSSLDGIAKLFHPSATNLQGAVSMEARLTGPPSKIAIDGELRLDDPNRSNLLPQLGARWKLGVRGNLDLYAETLRLETGADPKDAGHKDAKGPMLPFHVQSVITQFLTRPRYQADAELTEAPLGTALEVARHLGLPVPERMASQGSVSGAISYSTVEGFGGQLSLTDAKLMLAGSDGAPPVVAKAANAAIHFSPNAIELRPATVILGESEPVQVEGSFGFAPMAVATGPAGSASSTASGLDFRITTRGASLANVYGLGQGVGLKDVPVLTMVAQSAVTNADGKVAAIPGMLHGYLRYRDGSAGTAADAPVASGWTGEYEIRNASLRLNGIADAVRLTTASISMSRDRVSISKARGKAGQVPFAGEYRFDVHSQQAHQLRLEIGEASVVELDRLFRPALARDASGGFLSRTFRLGATPDEVPEWMQNRKILGTVSVQALSVPGQGGALTQLRLERGKLNWDGAKVTIADLDASVLPAALDKVAAEKSVGERSSQAERAAAEVGASISGELQFDLSGRAPRYRFEGKLGELAYKEGTLDFTGKLESTGTGLQVLTGLRASGTFKGRSIAFAPDAEFRTVSGSFEMWMGDLKAGGGLPRWTLSSLEVIQGSDVLAGSGSTQADGKLLLELTNKGRAVRYVGALLPVEPR